MIQAAIIHIKGLVQGVGFRPFIFLLAKKTGVNGWVRNTNAGVEIFAQAGKTELSEFISSIRGGAPSASKIEEFNYQDTVPVDCESFKIEESDDSSEDVTGISPDIAVCEDCLGDMEVQIHRRLYPFVNCTNCGPRFSIIRDLPYDRSKTSMNDFPMCDHCRSEYEDINDRRFHAQPVACIHCGPVYDLVVHGKRIEENTETILLIVRDMLLEGKIIAVKGIGGYHLACDAFNAQAVMQLRSRKRRDGKPLAMMFKDIDTLFNYANAGECERSALLSWQRPIVILEIKKKLHKDPLLFCVNSGLGSIGAFLPYMPMHHLLFRFFPGAAIVLTSGNLSAEPIVKDDDDAFLRFDQVADAFLTYNREVVNRSDDSVVRIIGNKVRMIRRSRGFVPTSVALNYDVNNIVAFGAELSSTFCVGRGNRAFLSQYIGDLKTFATYTFFEEALNDFIHLFQVRPEFLVCDLHPVYFSTKIAEKFDRVPLLHIQHHHAHVASCMGEHGLDEKVIGVAFDGTGYGSDGKIWGGEFLVCDLMNYKRVLHFEYIRLPGGDKAIEQPWRSAIAYLYGVFGPKLSDIQLPFLRQLNKEKLATVINMLDHGINCPEVSSVGRLFDAVAAILGICIESTFQAEAPMRLESLTDSNYSKCYSYEIRKTIHVDLMIREIIEDMLNELDIAQIATKFHNTVISIIFEGVKKISNQEKMRKVVLSGGVFQNKYILEMTENLLRKAGMNVYSNEQIPTNDGGIALGQLIIAGKRRSMKCV